jgi:hypothetical protein
VYSASNYALLRSHVTGGKIVEDAQQNLIEPKCTYTADGHYELEYSRKRDTGDKDDASLKDKKKRHYFPGGGDHKGPDLELPASVDSDEPTCCCEDG